MNVFTRIVAIWNMPVRIAAFENKLEQLQESLDKVAEQASDVDDRLDDLEREEPWHEAIGEAVEDLEGQVNDVSEKLSDLRDYANEIDNLTRELHVLGREVDRLKGGR